MDGGRFEDPAEFGSAVEAVLDALLAGLAVDEIVSRMMSQLEASAADVEVVLREVWGRLQQRSGCDDLRMAMHLERRRVLFHAALQTGDYGPALRALQDMAKLEGLYDEPPGEGGSQVAVNVPSIDDVDGLPVM